MKIYLIIISFFIFSASVHAEPLKVWINAGGRLPYVANSSPFAAATFNSAVLDHLLFPTSDFKFQSGLLEEARWDFSKKKYILRLKSGLRFHNGREATSHDLEFSLARGFFSKQPTLFRMHLGNILGADSIQAGTPYKKGSIEGIKVVDKYTVEITLQNQNPNFLNNLTYSFLSLVPQEELEKDLYTWKNKPIGVGPYKVTELRQDALEIDLENQTKTGPKKVTLFFGEPKSGFDLYLWDNETRPGYQIWIGPRTDMVVVILFNTLNITAKSFDFRMSLDLAINRSMPELNTDLFSGTSQFLPPSFWGRDSRVSEFNLNKARQHLQKAGTFPKQLSLDIPVRTSNFPEEISKALTNSFKDLGIDVKFSKVMSKFWNKDDKNTIISIISFSVADMDPLLKYGAFLPGGAMFPFSPDWDPDFKNIYEQAAKASSSELRVHTMEKLSKHVFDQKLLVPLYFRKPRHSFNSQKINSIGVQDGGNSFFIQRISTKN